MPGHTPYPPPPGLRAGIEQRVAAAIGEAAAQAGAALEQAAGLPPGLRRLRWSYSAGTLTGQVDPGLPPPEVRRVVDAIARVTAARPAPAVRPAGAQAEYEACGYTGDLTVLVWGVTAPAASTGAAAGIPAAGQRPPGPAPGTAAGPAADGTAPDGADTGATVAEDTGDGR